MKTITRTTCSRTGDTYATRDHRRECVARDCPGCQPCTHDDRGTPVRHCEARWKCTTHLAPNLYACARCTDKVRANLTRIITALAAMPIEAEDAGLAAEALIYAGPSAHPGAWRARMLHNAAHDRPTEDPDQNDPWHMLGVRERRIRLELGHDRLLVSPSLTSTCGYLDWVLTDLARNPDHLGYVRDLLTETGRLADHLEAVLRDSKTPERGAPCPRCPTPAPRLLRRWAHWCDEPDCDREHDLTGARDTWQCPRTVEHWWSEADYRLWVSDDYLANASRLTADQIESQHGIKSGTLRKWVERGKVHRRGTDQFGRVLYDVPEALAMRDARKAVG